MYEQLCKDTVFCMIYAAVAMLSLTACCYLLLRRANAFAPDITPPLRLRRWTAVFFACMTLSHVWYMPLIFLTSPDDALQCYLIAGLLDSITVFPSAIAVLFSMLQNRRRPLWMVGIMVAPPFTIMGWCVATHSDDLLEVSYLYLLLLGIGIIIYMICELRQYGRWLRDNYADLEHKEVWQSFVMFAVILLVFCLYVLSNKGLAYTYLLQLNDIVLICFLLWRVETLSDLCTPVNDAEEEELATTEDAEENSTSPAPANSIETLLKHYCEDQQLYLQHDISIRELARQIGTNRLYLSKHFTSQGITYNIYINRLRIQHFVNLYQESVAAHQPITIQQLALQSGFRNYGTFNTAFKQSMGMTATEWTQTSIS